MNIASAYLQINYTAPRFPIFEYHFLKEKYRNGKIS